jgi:hypothetical protein
MDCLRDFLRRELGDTNGSIPLNRLIARCYGELLRQANNGHKGKLRAELIQDKLRQIAAEFLRRHGRDPS